ncbi:MAG: hypothetical protein ACLUFN_00055 [Eubacterium sp.]
MRKFYSEPELEIRKYSVIQGNVLTASYPEAGGSDGDNTLDDDDLHDIFKP